MNSWLACASSVRHISSVRDIQHQQLLVTSECNHDGAQVNGHSLMMDDYSCGFWYVTSRPSLLSSVNSSSPFSTNLLNEFQGHPLNFTLNFTLASSVKTQLAPILRLPRQLPSPPVVFAGVAFAVQLAGTVSEYSVRYVLGEMLSACDI